MSSTIEYGTMMECAVAFLDGHYNENIRLDDVSAGFYIDKDYFRQLFKHHTGNSVTQYIQLKRMQEALRLLEHSDKSVEEISDICGYCDMSHFYKKFKGQTGMTPADYRKHIRQNQN